MTDYQPAVGDWVVVLRWLFGTDRPVPYTGQVLGRLGQHTQVSHPTARFSRGWWAASVRPASPEEVSKAQLASLEGL